MCNSPSRLIINSSNAYNQASAPVVCKWHRDRFSRFCMGPKCYDVQCIVNGEETPQIALPLDFIILPEKDLAAAIGNMHKKFGKDRACGSVDILADRQTHRHTQMYSLQYFATVPRAKYYCFQLQALNRKSCRMAFWQMQLNWSNWFIPAVLQRARMFIAFGCCLYCRQVRP